MGLALLLIWKLLATIQVSNWHQCSVFTAVKREEFAKAKRSTTKLRLLLSSSKVQSISNTLLVYATFQKFTKKSFKCLKTETGFIVDVIFQHGFLLARSVVNEKKVKFLRKVKRYLRQRTDLYIFSNFFTY